MKNDIAFLGMGMMGRHMASNIARSDVFTVHIWNRNKSSAGILLAQGNGCLVSNDFSMIAEKCSVICICLADADSIQEVLFGINGLAALLPIGTTIIDFSSIGRNASVCLAKKLNEVGIVYLDAPVSGGDVGAKNGTLSIMVGGSEEQCLPFEKIFKLVGSKVFFCKEIGNGQAVKSLNQLICAVNLVAVCEALLAAEKLGLDQKNVIEVCSSGAANSWALQNLGIQIAKRDFNPGFMVKHMIKDLNILERELPDDLDLPGFKLARTIFDQTGNLDDGRASELGTQAMFRTYVTK